MYTTYLPPLLSPYFEVKYDLHQITHLKEECYLLYLHLKYLYIILVHHKWIPILFFELSDSQIYYCQWSFYSLNNQINYSSCYNNQYPLNMEKCLLYGQFRYRNQRSAYQQMLNLYLNHSRLHKVIYTRYTYRLLFL